jgi:hypothetical protein
MQAPPELGYKHSPPSPPRHAHVYKQQVCRRRGGKQCLVPPKRSGSNALCGPTELSGLREQKTRALHAQIHVLLVSVKKAFLLRQPIEDCSALAELISVVLAAGEQDG